MADLIKSNGEIIKDVEATSLKQKQELVGGYIEYCPVDNDLFMYVDEEGLLKKKEVNHNASEMAGQMVVGDALLCSYKETIND